MATESQQVQWLIESNDEGQWALFARVAGAPTQLTAWLPTREDVLAALREHFRRSGGPYGS